MAKSVAEYSRLRSWAYTLKDIAFVSNRSLNTVRDHKEKGELEPGDFNSVAAYITRARILAALDGRKR